MTTSEPNAGIKYYRRRKAVPKQTGEICGMMFYKGCSHFAYVDSVRGLYRIPHEGLGMELMIDKPAFDRYFKEVWE